MVPPEESTTYATPSASSVTTPPSDDAEASRSGGGAQFLREFRVYAHQHAELARRNYAAFKSRYGHPLAPLRDAASTLRRQVDIFRSEAGAGWEKLEKDIEAKRAGAVHESNGNGPAQKIRAAR